MTRHQQRQLEKSGHLRLSQVGLGCQDYDGPTAFERARGVGLLLLIVAAIVFAIVRPSRPAHPSDHKSGAAIEAEAMQGE